MHAEQPLEVNIIADWGSPVRRPCAQMSLAQFGQIPSGPLASTVRRTLRSRPFDKLTMHDCRVYCQGDAMHAILSIGLLLTSVWVFSFMPDMQDKPTMGARSYCLTLPLTQVLGERDLTQVFGGPEETASADTRGLTTPVSSGIPYLSNATQVYHTGQLVASHTHGLGGLVRTHAYLHKEPKVNMRAGGGGGSAC